ncbi:hypothetical protein BJ138DRAFT_1147665 [Hygrophoropsis aurantiaca]|uniref:Uncharacterized protein n=1 Tax=Hygrophoropsis aurantiaca TaxID=72124 RepID=A0ACB8AHL3_9AGAM|nr:hypothetical protein BJ138DRAFT_1147665 [Hygrophoropsis aurantiaca]
MPLAVRATTSGVSASSPSMSGTATVTSTTASVSSHSGSSTTGTSAGTGTLTIGSSTTTSHSTTSTHTTPKHTASTSPLANALHVSGLSGGTIAGIIIAVGLGLLLIVGLVVFCILRRKKRSQGRGHFSKLEKAVRVSTIEELDDDQTGPKGLVAPVYVRERERGYGHVQHPSLSNEPLLVPLPVPRSSLTPHGPQSVDGPRSYRSQENESRDDSRGPIDPYARNGSLAAASSPSSGQHTVALPAADGITLSPLSLARDSPARPISDTSQYSHNVYAGLDPTSPLSIIPGLPPNAPSSAGSSDMPASSPPLGPVKGQPRILSQLLKSRAEATRTLPQQQSPSSNGRDRSNTFGSVSAFSPDDEEDQARALAEAEWNARLEERHRLRLQIGDNMKKVEDDRMAYSDDEDSEPDSPDSIYSQLSATTTVQDHFAYLDLSSAFADSGSGSLARRKSSRRKSFRRRQAMSPVPEVPGLPEVPVMPPTAFRMGPRPRPRSRHRPPPLPPIPPSIASVLPQSESVDLPLLSSNNNFGTDRSSLTTSAQSFVSTSNSNYAGSEASRYPSLASKSSSALHQQQLPEPPVPNWRAVPGGLDALKDLEILTETEDPPLPMHNPHSPPHSPPPPQTPRSPLIPRSPAPAGPRSPPPMGPRSPSMGSPRQFSEPPVLPELHVSTSFGQPHLRLADSSTHIFPAVDGPEAGLERGGIASLDINF